VPSVKCSIGQRLLGHATPSRACTVIAVSERATLNLDGCHVGRGAAISIGPGGVLSVGVGTYIADGSRAYSTRSISIGRSCSISWNVTIIDDDGHGFGPPPYSTPVIIGDDVWIGCNATILKGVTIGSGSVIAAGAVVAESCPPRSLIGGVPARVIRSDVEWTDEARLARKQMAR
jgi:acetyltransferase-like isoleucine patch superfamily enzyme